MAKRAGCFAIWAKYGAHTDPVMYERLMSADDIERKKNYSNQAKFIEPDFVCEKSLREILPLVSEPALMNRRGGAG